MQQSPVFEVVGVVFLEPRPVAARGGGQRRGRGHVEAADVLRQSDEGTRLAYDEHRCGQTSSAQSRVQVTDERLVGPGRGQPAVGLLGSGFVRHLRQLPGAPLPLDVLDQLHRASDHLGDRHPRVAVRVARRVDVQQVESLHQVLQVGTPGARHGLLQADPGAQFFVPMPGAAVVPAHVVQAVEPDLLGDPADRADERGLVPAGNVAAADLARVHLVAAGNEEQGEVTLLRQLQRSADDAPGHRPDAKERGVRAGRLQVLQRTMELRVGQSSHCDVPLPSGV